MIKHLVLLKVAAEFVNSSELSVAIQALADLKNQAIPQIQSFAAGHNNSSEGLSREYNYGFVMEFANNFDRDYYLNHSEHRRIASQMLLPLLSDGINSVLVVDF